MLGNIILGFIIPILEGGYILKNNLRILLTYFPLGIASSACINSIGFNIITGIYSPIHIINHLPLSLWILACIL